MLFKNLHINPDSVQLDEQLIERPFYMAPSVWIDFWEASLQIEDQSVADELKDEVDDLQGEVRSLKEEVVTLENSILDLERQIELLEEEFTNSYRE